MKTRSRLLRWHLPIVAAGAFASVVAARAAGQEALLRAVGIPALPYAFGDLRSISSGWQCAQSALDPLRSNPCDPDLRPMNYPRIWLLPGKLGLDDRATVVLGVVLGGIFLVSVLILFRRVPSRDGPIALLAICSPPCLLLLERGNNDIVVFVLVLLAILLSERTRQSWGLVPLWIGAVLKLYPAICIIGLLLHRPSRSTAVGAVAALTGFAIYLVLTLEDLRSISALPRRTVLSYGSSVLPDLIGVASASTRDRFGLILFLLVLAGGCVLGRRLRRDLARGHSELSGRRSGLLLALSDSPSPPSPPDRAFILGTALYLGTFALGNNFDYRLVMLLFVVPQILSWARESSLAPAAWGALGVVLGTLWLGHIISIGPPSLPPLDEAANWMLVAALPALAIATWSPMERPALVSRSK